MSNKTPRVWFITGASTGFGRNLAEAVLANGDRVVATARKPETVADLEQQNPSRARAVRQSAKRRIHMRFPHIRP